MAKLYCVSSAMTTREALTADSAVALLQRYLRKEKLHWQPCKYAMQGDEITSARRNHTVKWLQAINRCLKFTPETLFLSVTLMDELLRLVRARPKYLRCIAVSCLYLASKIIEEPEVVPQVKHLITKSNCSFSVSEITRMEAAILKKFEWDLCRATALDFLHGFHALLVLNRGLFLQDRFVEELAALGPLLETTLQSCLDQDSLLAERPSTVALSLVSLELETRTRSWFVVTMALKKLAQAETSDVIRCREELACVLSTSAHTAVSPQHRHLDSQSASKPPQRKTDNMDKKSTSRNSTATTAASPPRVAAAGCNEVTARLTWRASQFAPCEDRSHRCQGRPSGKPLHAKN